jgi:hypothetical protein
MVATLMISAWMPSSASARAASSANQTGQPVASTVTWWPGRST